MTITIRPIKEASDIFDVNRSQGTFFWRKDGKSVLMTNEEQKDFKSSNFAVGYAGTDIRLSCWANKMRRELRNINLDMPVHALRLHLWMLVKTDFTNLDRQQKREQGYYTFNQFVSIAETSKNHDITLWILSSFDVENADLFKRFLTYLANK